MTSPLVECITNFSEGRRLEVVEAIVESIKAVEGVTLLDYSSDADHNRSVVTYIGTPEGVEKAAFESIAKAAELIDMDAHSGEHPRLGATDVVPFVPIAGVTMAECVEMAQRVGKRVGEELGIPVFLYERAASRPDRANLAKVRKGEYEALKEDIENNPDREPDFGPTKLPKAGATIIGARAPLVAYNVYLDTGDVEVAKKVGKAVRHMSGGLRYVKALGMMVEGKAQVSMNLTNYLKTPVYRVVEMIRREAARYGAQVTASELIGLIPQQALIDAATWYLQLDDFDESQVLEIRMAEAQAEEGGAARDKFLADLAAGTAVPGGGSAAAYAGAMGAGLVAMVARLTVGKKKYAEVEERMKGAAEEADGLRAELEAAVAEDSAAFEAVMAAFKLPKGKDEEKQARSEAIQVATLKAAEVPLGVCEKAVRVMELAAEMAETGNANAITDGGTGGAMAAAALRGAGLNVRINLGSLKDEKAVEKLKAKLESLEKQADAAQKRLDAALRERGGLEI